MTDLLQTLPDWSQTHPAAWNAGRPAALVLLAWLSFHAAHTLLLRWVARLIRASRTQLDDALLDRGVLRRLALEVYVFTNTVVWADYEDICGGRRLFHHPELPELGAP